MDVTKQYLVLVDCMVFVRFLQQTLICNLVRENINGKDGSGQCSVLKLPLLAFFQTTSKDEQKRLVYNLKFSLL